MHEVGNAVRYVTKAPELDTIVFNVNIPDNKNAHGSLVQSFYVIVFIFTRFRCPDENDIYPCKYFHTLAGFYCIFGHVTRQIVAIMARNRGQS